MQFSAVTTGAFRKGRSADGTLIYEWKVAATGERRFEAKLWNGRDYRTVLDQRVPAPKP